MTSNTICQKNERRDKSKHKKMQSGLQEQPSFLIRELSLISNDKRQALVDIVKLFEEGLWVMDKAENWESDGEFGFEHIDNTTSDTDSDQ